MDADERPNKFRKLSHGASAAVGKSVDGTTPVEGYPLSASYEVTGSAEQNLLSATAEEFEQHECSQVEVEPDSKSTPAPSTPLSKNQLKRLRKQQEWEAGKDWRKARRKEKTKERKERKRERQAKQAEQQKALGQPPAKRRVRRPKLLPVTFVIDCGFDDKMVDKERISLGSQITRAYSDNSHAPFQANLVVSSWGGLLKERFDTILDKQWVKWKGIHFTEHDFVAASEKAKEAMSNSRGSRLEGVFRKYAPQLQNDAPRSNTQQGEPAHNLSTNGPSNGPPADKDSADPGPEHDDGLDSTPESDQDKPSTDQTPPTPLPEPQVIYLTSDSPHTLTTLDPYSTYIIGGLVDKNRHKGICYRTAMDRGVKTAKLPIGQYMEMNSRFVLATNHVVEIMIRYLECGDWGEAFMKVVPKRKGGKLKETDAKGDEGHSDNDENHNDYDDDDDDDQDSSNSEAGNLDGGKGDLDSVP